MVWRGHHTCKSLAYGITMYATLDDMLRLFGEGDCIALTDREGTGEINPVVLDDALLRASSEADTYLARYALPINPVPPALISVVCDITRYRLVGGDISESSPVYLRYARAVAWLKDISAGKAALPDQAGQAVQTGGVVFFAGERVWGEGNGWNF